MKMAMQANQSNKKHSRLIGSSIFAFALMQVSAFGAANAQDQSTTGTLVASSSTRVTADAPFGPLKHIKAGFLDVAYAETGPANGPAVILLHGWPYDIHSYDEVAPLLAAKGYRVLMPYARGYGDTRFLSEKTT